MDCGYKRTRRPFWTHISGGVRNSKLRDFIQNYFTELIRFGDNGDRPSGPAMDDCCRISHCIYSCIRHRSQRCRKLVWNLSRSKGKFLYQYLKHYCLKFDFMIILLTKVLKIIDVHVYMESPILVFACASITFLTVGSVLYWFSIKSQDKSQVVLKILQLHERHVRLKQV